MMPKSVRHLGVDDTELAAFCQRWRIGELALFGSALRDDWPPDSDVDLLVTFDATAEWSLLDLVQMEQELSVIFARAVDLATRKSVERSKNWIRRQAILTSAEPLYAA